MSELAIKSLNHLYRILKVYLSLGLIGALIGVCYSVFAHYQYKALLLLTIVTGFFLLKRLLSFTLQMHPRPPEFLELLLGYMLPAKDRDAVLGDFHAMYAKHYKESAVRAYFWYWKEIVMSIWILSRYASQIRSTVREILPLYRVFKN